MSKPLRIAGLSGSLRSASFNTALLRAANALSPDAEVEVLSYDDVPFFNGDIDAPASVERLKAEIAAADGVIIAVPEYNYSVPGVLKNALDWVSRPAYNSVFRDKPVGVMSAAPGFVGGARGQQHAKTILLGMAARVFPWPELLVGGAGSKFTDGELTDEVTQRFLREYMEGFVAFASGR